LFVRLGSPVGELTLPTLVNEPLAGAVTVTVTLLTCPLANATQTPAYPAAVVHTATSRTHKRHSAGNVSVTTTPLALDGPKFVTEIV